MSLEIQASAPGKVILHGEHAVVYGKAAIAVSVNLQNTVRITPREDGQLVVRLGFVDLDAMWTVVSIAPSQASAA